MANEYQKINTLFMRDANNIIMPDKMTCPEFDYLKDCRWECTEKNRRHKYSLRCCFLIPICRKRFR